jgi:ribosomal protein S18 acetylase RimI-like enzyme
MSIRKYRDSDKQDLLEVYVSASRVGHPFIPEAKLVSLAQVVADKYVPIADTYVYADAEDKLIGFVSLIEGTFIGGFFVSPKAARQGIGHKLLAHVREVFQAKPLQVEVLVDNKVGRAFYAKQGFVFVKEYMDEDLQLMCQLLELKPLSQCDSG